MASGQTWLGGRYQLGEVLGRGGMAEVRRGHDARLGRQVAVKQMVSSLAADPVCQARFQREARSAAGLSHPKIVAVLDTGERDDPDTGVTIPYLVMELVDGKTLGAVLRGDGKMLPERALELTGGVLEALSHSHDAGIVHRDIKPGNVMVTAAGDVKVMDFGIARAVSDTSTDFTQTASVIGSAHYLSPEQARGERVGFRSDLYSAGCLLYELLVGRPPFVGESVLSVIYQQVREAPVPPSQIDPGVSADIDAIVLTALAKDPEQRYPSAREMKGDIDRVLAGHRPVAALPAASQPGISAGTVSHGGADDADPVVAAVAPTSGRGRTARGVAWVTTVVLLLLGFGGYGFYRSLGTEASAGELAHVPDVVGRSQSEAEQMVAKAGLALRVHQVHGARDRTLHDVIAQTPAGGRDVELHSLVTVEVNGGPVAGAATTTSGAQGSSSTTSSGQAKTPRESRPSAASARSTSAGPSPLNRTGQPAAPTRRSTKASSTSPLAAPSARTKPGQPPSRTPKSGKSVPGTPKSGKSVPGTPKSGKSVPGQVKSGKSGPGQATPAKAHPPRATPTRPSTRRSR